MELLAKTLKKNGFIYELVDRNQHVAFYQLDGGTSGYEVFLIPIAKEREVFGKGYPERERLPGNEEFGIKFYSKSFHGKDAKERATKYYEWLKTKFKERKNKSIPKERYI